jgi:hypothetical protein
VIRGFCTVSTPFAAWCPVHGLVSRPETAENPNVFTVYCPQCFALLGVEPRREPKTLASLRRRAALRSCGERLH